MSMIKCSPEAFELCKTKCYHCRGEDVAYFLKGSDCDKFNQEVAAPKTEPDLREKLIDIITDYADFLDWERIDGIADTIMEKCFATDNNKWIPVTERLPEKWQDIIAYDAKNQEIHLAYMTEDAWVGVRMNGKVTHWMPLPEPPIHN